MGWGLSSPCSGDVEGSLRAVSIVSVCSWWAGPSGSFQVIPPGSAFFPATPSNRMTNPPIAGIFLSRKRFLRAEQGRSRKVRKEDNLTPLRGGSKPRRCLAHCSKKHH